MNCPLIGHDAIGTVYMRIAEPPFCLAGVLLDNQVQLRNGILLYKLQWFQEAKLYEGNLNVRLQCLHLRTKYATFYISCSSRNT